MIRFPDLRHILGAQGEDLAFHYLQNKADLKILARNWKSKLGEIDLIAQSRDGKIVIVEVKTRALPEEGWEAVDLRKRKRLRRLALCYLSQQGLPLETALRFDVVVVTKTGEIHHEPEAFMAEKEI